MKHLFVLIHGMWGSSSHMKSMLKVYKDKLPDDTIFFVPAENAKFKTFDGIEIIGYRTLIELCQFINNYQDTHSVDDRIDRISIVGYSLGGLIARFVIGKCFNECMEIFHDIKPILFISVATPHLGIEFYNNNSWFRAYLLNPLMKILGSTFLGKSGRDLFIMNSYNNILIRLSKDEYLKSLSLFQERICFANVKNDRTVAFYTAFISNYDPFITTNNQIKYFFDNDIPDMKNFTNDFLPRIPDLNKLDPNIMAPKNPEMVTVRRKITFVLLFTLFLIVFFPIALILNICGTIYSYFSTWKYRKMIGNYQNSELPKAVSEKIGLSNQLQRYVSETYENLLNNNHSGTDSMDTVPTTDDIITNMSSSQDYNSIDNSINQAKVWSNFSDKYSNILNHDQKWLEIFKPLPLDESRTTIFKNLSTLRWIRIPIYIKAMNAHAGIIARRGLNENTARTSVAALELQANLINHFMK